MLFRESDDDGEEGPFELSLQIGCLIVVLSVGLVIGLVWLSRPWAGRPP
jgi:hypothetical protein